MFRQWRGEPRRQRGHPGMAHPERQLERCPAGGAHCCRRGSRQGHPGGDPDQNPYRRTPYCWWTNQDSAQQRDALASFAQHMGGELLKNISQVIPVQMELVRTLILRRRHVSRGRVCHGADALIFAKTTTCAARSHLLPAATESTHSMPAVALTDAYRGPGWKYRELSRQTQRLRGCVCPIIRIGASAWVSSRRDRRSHSSGFGGLQRHSGKVERIGPLTDPAVPEAVRQAIPLVTAFRSMMEQHSATYGCASRGPSEGCLDAVYPQLAESRRGRPWNIRKGAVTTGTDNFCRLLYPPLRIDAQ